MSTPKRSDAQSTTSAPLTDPVLVGQNTMPGIVAAQLLNESTIRLYTRTRPEDNSADPTKHTTFTDVEFFPFFFLSTPVLLEGYSRRFWIKELSGNNYFRFLVAFSRSNDLWDAVRFVLQTYNKSALKRAGHYTELEPLLLKADPVTQYLLQSGVTLFKGMSFKDLHRLQIRIATHSRPGKRSDPRKTEDRITAIVLSDNAGWEEILDGRKHTEVEMIRLASEAIVQRDPDVIEGHDLLEHTIPYLLRRAELLSTEITIGRDGSSVRSFSLRGNPLEPDYENVFFEVAGRHLLDTRHLAHNYNSTRRAFEQYGLHYIAQQLGLSSRSESQRSVATSASAAPQPESVIRLLKHDCGEIRALSEHFAPSYFFQTQMVPLAFDSLLRAGSAAKIELMMMREYIRQKHSVPKPESGTQHTGGYTDIFITGILDNVLNVDIESLYPSIMLTQHISPATDELGIFEKLLGSLTATRLDAKRQMLASTDTVAQRNLDALQSSLKILVNSFYGYLGYGRGLFNDYAQADRVTSMGQDLLRIIIREVELHNGRVIEADTDGLFFVPPDNVVGEEQEGVFVQKLSSSLPAGINLAFSGRYKKMLSYRKKNYALLDHSDRLAIRGSAMISRSLERFAREYLRLCINCLLQQDVRGLHNLYVTLKQDISEHRWDVQDFCRTESIRDPLETYENDVREGRRKPTASYEVAKRAGLPIKPGQHISYYVTGTHAGVKIADNSKLAEEWDPNFPDENTAYYHERLEECSRKFDLFFGEQDFKQVFSADDLFGFDPAKVRIVKDHTVPRDEAPPEEDTGDFGIWLDESGQ
jgi:DNA polymerase I